jgi:hypothetical protein
VIDCRQAIVLMHERLSGADEAGGAGFDAHVLECGRCRAHYRALLELARVATRIEPPAPPASLRRRVAAAIAPGSVPAPADRRWLTVALAAAVCVVLVLAIGYRSLWHAAAALPGVSAAWTSVVGWLHTLAEGLGNLVATHQVAAAADWLWRWRPAVAASPVLGLVILLLLAANFVLIRLAGRTRPARA